MPAKLEACVTKLVNDPKFKPGVDPKKRRSSAYAICTASTQKEMFDDISKTLEQVKAIYIEKGK